MASHGARPFGCEGGVELEHALSDGGGLVQEVHVSPGEHHERPPAPACELDLSGVGVTEGEVGAGTRRPVRWRSQAAVEVAQWQARAGAIQLIEAVLGDDAGEVVA